jgi:hypothetical protein
VWTGSTNLSEGGIFGHSNVGHVVRDGAVAGRYLDFWSELQADPELATTQAWTDANSPFAQNDVNSAGIHTLFSPRSNLDPLDWYAGEFADGPSASSSITLPFGMTQAFEDKLTPYNGPALHFVMLDQHDSHQAIWSASKQVFVAVGSEGGPDSLARWAKEALTGFNVHVPYLHTKILLVDPLSANPTVISGSANFSPNSTDLNDENMPTSTSRSTRGSFSTSTRATGHRNSPQAAPLRPRASSPTPMHGRHRTSRSQTRSSCCARCTRRGSRGTPRRRRCRPETARASRPCPS